MNALSGTSLAGATAVAAFAGALVLAVLPRPAALPGVCVLRSVPVAASAAALLPVAPMLDDCARFAPPHHGADEAPRSATVLAISDTSTPSNNAARNDLGERSDRNDGGCDPDGRIARGDGAHIGGLGSGWIISADGVMRMNPYSLSDAHSITVRPAEPLMEFKGRVIGLGRAGNMAQGAHRVPEGKERRTPLVVRNHIVHPARPGTSAAADRYADSDAHSVGLSMTSAPATQMADLSPTRRARV